MEAGATGPSAEPVPAGGRDRTPAASLPRSTFHASPHRPVPWPAPPWPGRMVMEGAGHLGLGPGRASGRLAAPKRAVLRLGPTGSRWPSRVWEERGLPRQDRWRSMGRWVLGKPGRQVLPARGWPWRGQWGRPPPACRWVPVQRTPGVPRGTPLLAPGLPPGQAGRRADPAVPVRALGRAPARARSRPIHPMKARVAAAWPAAGRPGQARGPPALVGPPPGWARRCSAVPAVRCRSPGRRQGSGPGRETPVRYPSGPRPWIARRTGLPRAAMGALVLPGAPRQAGLPRVGPGAPRVPVWGAGRRLERARTAGWSPAVLSPRGARRLVPCSPAPCSPGPRTVGRPQAGGLVPGRGMPVRWWPPAHRSVPAAGRPPRSGRGSAGSVAGRSVAGCWCAAPHRRRRCAKWRCPAPAPPPARSA